MVLHKPFSSPKNSPTVQSGTIYGVYINSGNYPQNYWPDWGPILSSNDEGDPTGTGAPGPQFVPPRNGVAICNGGVASTAHMGVMNVGLADGSVRNVSAQVSSASWWYAMTPLGGDIPGSDW